MLITATSLLALRTSFDASFQNGFGGVDPAWSKIATEIRSQTRENTYGWLGDFPGMRRWVGGRVIKSIAEHGYKIVNEDFESTVGVNRNDILDDTLGIYGPMFQELGRAAAAHPDELIFGLLAKGFAEACFDGQNFFDTDHPVVVDGEVTSVSNMQAGAGTPWFLMDTSRALKPLIYQNRKGAEFVAKDDPEDENVFHRKEYVYGVDSRCNVGFGFWQMAFGSKDDLTPENFGAARASMMSLKNDEGRPLGVKPTLMVVGPGNGEKAREVIKRERQANGATNVWQGEVEILETPYLS